MKKNLTSYMIVHRFSKTGYTFPTIITDSRKRAVEIVQANAEKYGDTAAYKYAVVRVVVPIPPPTAFRRIRLPKPTTPTAATDKE